MMLGDTVGVSSVSASGFCVTSGLALDPRSISVISVQEITGAAATAAGTEVRAVWARVIAVRALSGAPGGAFEADGKSRGGTGGALARIGAVSDSAAGIRSIVSWNKDLATPVIGTAEFDQTVWISRGRFAVAVSPSTVQ